MPRDSSGNYTLPAGNPVVTGSTIASSWANTTFNDLATEMTDSLDRSGKGGMLAPFKVVDGTVSAPGFAFQSETGTGLYRIGAGELGIATLGALRVQIGPNGQVIINPAGTGNSLTVFTNSTSICALLLEAPASQSVGVLQFYDSTNAVIRGYMGGGGVITGQANADFGIAAGTGGNLIIGRAAGVAIGTSFGPNGNITVSAPSSGDSLHVNGASGGSAGLFVGASAAGNSFGIGILAGTNSSDYSLDVLNQAGTTTYFKVRGDGLTQVVDDGGTLQQVGYRGIPINVQTVNYTLALSDRGKSVNANGSTGQNITVPANVFAANDVVTIICSAGSAGSGVTNILQGTGLSLIWGNGGTGTGNRAAATWSIATIVFMSPTFAVITGSALS